MPILYLQFLKICFLKSSVLVFGYNSKYNSACLHHLNLLSILCWLVWLPAAQHSQCFNGSWFPEQKLLEKPNIIKFSLVLQGKRVLQTILIPHSKTYSKTLDCNLTVACSFFLGWHFPAKQNTHVTKCVLETDCSQSNKNTHALDYWHSAYFDMS